jgi:hypothetical protein
MRPVIGLESRRSGGLRFAELADVPPYHYGAMFERI